MQNDWNRQEEIETDRQTESKLTDKACASPHKDKPKSFAQLSVTERAHSEPDKSSDASEQDWSALTHHASDRKAFWIQWWLNTTKLSLCFVI